jgi:hypothetical protein
MSMLRAIYAGGLTVALLTVLVLAGAYMLTRADGRAPSVWGGSGGFSEGFAADAAAAAAVPAPSAVPALSAALPVAPEAEMDVASAVAIAAAYKAVYKMDPGVEEVKAANRAMRASGTGVTSASAEAYLRGRLEGTGGAGRAALGAAGAAALPSVQSDGGQGVQYLRSVEAEMEAIVNRLDRLLDSVHARVADRSGRGGGPGALVTDRPLAGAADRRRRTASDPQTLAEMASSAARSAAIAAASLTGQLPATTALTGTGGSAPRNEGFYEPWSAGGEGWSSDDEGY